MTINEAIRRKLAEVRRKISDAEDEIRALADRGDDGARERVERLETHISRLRTEEVRLDASLERQEHVQASHARETDLVAAAGRQATARQVTAEKLAEAEANGTLRSEGGADEGSQRERLTSIRQQPFGRTDVRSRAYGSVGEWEGAPLGAVGTLQEIIRRSSDEPEGEALARQIEVTSRPAYRSAWRELMTSDTPLLSEAEVRAVRESRTIQRAMSLTDANGGYLVPSPLDPSLIHTGAQATSAILRLARSIQMTATTWTGVTATAATSYFQAEGAEATDGSPTIDEITLTARAQRTWLPYSYEVAEDATNFETEMTSLMREASTELLKSVLLTGAAVSNQPIGLLTALDGGASEVDTATASTLAVGDVRGLYNDLPPRWRDSSTWLMNGSIAQDIAEFVNPDNVALPPVPTSLMTRPLAIESNMDSAVTTGNKIAVLGDFSQFLVGRRIGFTISRVPFLLGATNRYPEGRGGFFGWLRVASDVAVDDAFRVLVVA